MKKKFFVISLIFCIILFQIDQQKKQADAFLPIAFAIPPAVSYVMAAMVAAGAVGYVTQDENGVWGGNLYDKALATYNAMAADVKQNLSAALAVGSFVAMNVVPGLWDFFHQRFMVDSTIPQTAGLIDPDTFFKRGTSVSFSVSGGVGNGAISTTSTNGGPYSMYTFTVNLSPSSLGYPYQTIMGFSGITPQTYYESNWPYFVPLTPYVPVMTSYLNSFIGSDVEVTSSWSITLYLNQANLTLSGFPTTTVVAPIPVISDGTDARPINPPANPLDLNNATSTTTYLDRNGVSTTAVPTTGVQLETGAIDTDTTDTASIAAAAAIAAALAAGLSQAAADAAGAAASAAIWAGQTAAAAAAVGVAAAAAVSAAVIANTGALSTDIATTKPGDVLDFSKLKFAASLFTNKFPFSLPWDIQRMLTSFGSGSVATPTFEMPIMGIPAHVSMSRFDGIASAARVFELFIFNIGLLFGTRKILGGAS